MVEKTEAGPKLSEEERQETISRREFLGCGAAAIAYGVACAAAGIGGYKWLSEKSDATQPGQLVTPDASTPQASPGTGLAPSLKDIFSTLDVIPKIEIRHKPVIINDIPTFGVTDPLSQEDLTRLGVELNASERKMQEDTYYTTAFIHKSRYDSFATDIYGSFPQYLSRHIEHVNTLIQSADAQNPTKIDLRRVVVIEDDVQRVLAPTIYDYISDSDAGFIFKSDVHRSKREESITSDPLTQLDKDLIRDIAMDVLRLPNQDLLHYTPADNEAVGVFTGFTNDRWRRYDPGLRMDISYDLFTQSSDSIGTYINHLLRSRIQNRTVHSHGKQEAESGLWFPTETPRYAQIQLGDNFANSPFYVFKAEFDPTKPLVEGKKGNLLPGKSITHHSGTWATWDGNVEIPLGDHEPGTIFARQNERIYGQDATMLFMAAGRDGHWYLRWFDIRDANIAYWKSYRDIVGMKMNFVRDDDTGTTETFDWRIDYFGYQEPLPTA